MKNKTTILAALALCLCATCLFGQSTDKKSIASQVDSLAREAQKTAQQGNLDAALTMLDAADKLALAHFGAQSQEYATCLFRRGGAFFFANRYPAAIEPLEKAEALFATADEPLTKNRIGCSNLLGGSYTNVGNLQAAETSYRRSLDIAKQVFGEKTAEYLGTKSNLLNLFIDMGRYGEAIEIAKSILSVREELVGKMHPKYALNLNQLGIIYATIGNFEEAEPILIEVSNILEKTIGTDNNDYASPLINLAAIYLDTRRYAEAEALNLKAKEILEKVLGPQHPFCAEVLNNLGVLYWKQQRYDEAAECYRKTLDIREQVFGKEHPLYAGTQLNLGIVYLETGKLGEAETLFAEVKAAYQKTPGNQSLPYAECRANQANLFVEKKRLEEAGKAYEEAIGIFEQSEATRHPNFIVILDKFAKWQLLTGEVEASISTQKRKLELLEETAAKAATFMSEQELSDYARALSEAGDIAFSCLSKLADYRESLAPICYNKTLFEKGFLQNSVGQIRRLAHTDSTATLLFNQLTEYRRQLASQYSLPAPERNSDLVAQFESDAEKVEKSLVHEVAGYGETVRQVDWQEVQAALNPGEAAVEFVHYQLMYPDKTEQVQYAALLVRPGDRQPFFVPLFEEKQLNDLLRKRKNRRSDYVNDLYGSVSPQLYNLIWKNLEPALEGVKKIYFSPSGLLFRLNLAAIPAPGNANATLADRYQFVQLGSTRQLVVTTPGTQASKAALVYGGVQYDADSTAMLMDTAPASSLVSRSRGELDFSSTDFTLRGGTWSYLKWTEKEAGAVQSCLSAAGFRSVLQSGFQATEKAFKEMSKTHPQVIHLATHGYFFPDTKNREEVRGMKEDEPVFKTSEQPMIRSGLILAGGNHAWTTGKSRRPDLEDGILTAYEISQLDLSGTELVVLSACETGLGDIDGNEGVYGLQRAFKIAGAKYLVMSLWQVPDQQTQELMAAFYDNWLVKKMSIPDAFRAAQQSVRERYEHPFFWAGFVLVE